MKKSHVAKLAFALLALTAVIVPAVALGVNPIHRGAPGPLLGAGLPAVAALVGAYLVARRRRRGKDV